MAKAQGKAVLIGSLDSLVSTCTNATAGLIVIALVTMISVGGKVRTIVQRQYGSQLSPDAVQEVRDQRPRLEQALNEIRKRGGIPEVSLPPALLGVDDVKSLIDDIERVAKNPVDLNMLAKSNALSRILGYEKQNSAMQVLIERYKAALFAAAQPPGSAEKLLTLPERRLPPEGMLPVHFICRNGRIFPFNVDDLGKKFEETLRTVLNLPEKSAIAIETDSMPKIVNYFYAHDIGNEYIRMKVDHVAGALLVNYSFRKNDQGETYDQLNDSTSNYVNALRSMDPSTRYIRYLVWADSFDLYNEARRIATKYNIMAGWEPYDKDEPLRELLVSGEGKAIRSTID